MTALSRTISLKWGVASKTPKPVLLLGLRIVKVSLGSSVVVASPLGSNSVSVASSEYRPARWEPQKVKLLVPSTASSSLETTALPAKARPP